MPSDIIADMLPEHKSRQPLRARTMHRATCQVIRHKTPDKDWIILAWQLKEKKAVKDKPLTTLIFANI